MARESVPQEIANYKAKLDAIYSFPEQLVFIFIFRCYAVSARGEHCYCLAYRVNPAATAVLILRRYGTKLVPICDMQCDAGQAR